MAFTNMGRLGQVNNANAADALFLKVFSGEVLTAFERSTVMTGRVFSKTIPYGKSASFACTGRYGAAGVGAYYHTVGQEIVFDNLNVNEKVITIDGKLIAPAFIPDIDEAMNHFESRFIYTNQIGENLAYLLDRHLMIEGLLGARANNLVTGLDNGTVVTDADFASADLATKATALAAGLFTAAEALDTHWVKGERYVILAPAEYYAVVQNLDAINSDWGGSGAYSDGTVTKVAGITILKHPGLPNTTIANSDLGYSIHYGDFQYTKGLVFTPNSIGLVKLMDLSMQSEYNLMHQGTVMLARMAVGCSWLRPECLVELASQ